MHFHHDTHSLLLQCTAFQLLLARLQPCHSANIMHGFAETLDVKEVGMCEKEDERMHTWLPHLTPACRI